MKFSTAILLQIIIVLTTLPLTHNLFVTKQATGKLNACGLMCAQKQKTTNKIPCGNGLCNPFLSCPFCVYVNTESYTLTEISFSLSSTLNTFRNERYISAYSAECWHPPQSVEI